MAQPANNDCCGGPKRASGVAVIVCGVVAALGLMICSAVATDVPLYAGFGWFNVLLSVVTVIVASVYVCGCCGEGCSAKVVGGIMVAYCVIALVSFLVCASGADSAIRSNCEGTVQCEAAAPWIGEWWDEDCGQKTSSFQLCSRPDTNDRRRLQGGGKFYYSRWGDDCHKGGGGDDHCRAFETEKDCWNYCNPHNDHSDDQCEDVDGPEDCSDGTSITSHARGLALWSSLLILLLLIPSAVWTVCLFQLEPPQANEPPTVSAVEMASVQVRHAAPPQIIYAPQPPPQIIYAPQPQVGQVVYAQEQQPPLAKEGY